MSTTEITIHGCIKLRVSRYYPHINRALTLELVTDTVPVPILTFGLQQEDIDKLLANFSDEETTISHKADPVTGNASEDKELELLLDQELEGIGVVILGPGNAAA